MDEYTELELAEMQREHNGITLLWKNNAWTVEYPESQADGTTGVEPYAEYMDALTRFMELADLA